MGYTNAMLTVGIDEVGRGCWAGPLVAAAVILPSDLDLRVVPVELRDSKKMTKKQRETAAAWIHSVAVAVGIGWVEPATIDTHGLSWAVKTAMEQSLAEIAGEYDEVIIDGAINYFASDRRSRAIVKADNLVPAVSAASIVAKVARDAYMNQLDKKYAGYGFEKHVGYGTAAHIVALKSLGVSDIHRRSYKPIQALLT